MAQTRPSPTLSRGFTRLGRFLAPYGQRDQRIEPSAGVYHRHAVLAAAADG